MLSKFLHLWFFCRAMLCISAAYADMRCLFVCLCVRVSVTFVSCVKTNKHIIKCFHHRIATPFYLFNAKHHSNIPSGTPPLTGASNAGGVREIAILSLYLAVVLLLALQHARCCQQGRRWTTATVSQVMTHYW